jgi:hypothetical protein
VEGGTGGGGGGRRGTGTDATAGDSVIWETAGGNVADVVVVVVVVTGGGTVRGAVGLPSSAVVTVPADRDTPDPSGASFGGNDCMGALSIVAMDFKAGGDGGGNSTGKVLDVDMAAASGVAVEKAVGTMGICSTAEGKGDGYGEGMGDGEANESARPA